MPMKQVGVAFMLGSSALDTIFDEAEQKESIIIL